MTNIYVMKLYFKPMGLYKNHMKQTFRYQNRVTIYSILITKNLFLF